MKTLSFLVMCCFGLATFAQSGPKFTLIDKKIMTETVKVNTPVEAYFKFKNEGDAPLIIQTAYATCECTQAEWPKNVILPGKVDSILVTFDGTKLGAFNKPVYIETNASDKREVIFLKGEVLDEQQ